MDVKKLKQMSYVDGNDFFGNVPSLNIAKNYKKVFDYIKDVWKDTPDDVMIHFYGSDLTAFEFFEQVVKVTKSLKMFGLNKGDTIILSLYDDRVVEMSVNGNSIITVDDCIASYTNQIKVSLISAPICIIILAIIFIVTNRALKKHTFTNNGKTYKTKIKINIDNTLYNNIQKSI